MPTVFEDATANGYDFVLPNETDWTVNVGALINGDNSVSGDSSMLPAYNVHGDDFHLGDGTAWAVEFVMNTVNKGVVDMIACCNDAGTNTSAWYISIDVNERIDFTLVNTSNAVYVAALSSLVSTGVDHHVLIEVDTTASPKVSIYVDDTLVGDSGGSTGTGTPRTPTSTYRVYLGANGDATSDMYNVKLAHFAIYDNDITPTQRNNHYVALTT